jgi:hypothetical protein
MRHARPISLSAKAFHTSRFALMRRQCKDARGFAEVDLDGS